MERVGVIVLNGFHPDRETRYSTQPEASQNGADCGCELKARLVAGA